MCILYKYLEGTVSQIFFYLSPCLDFMESREKKLFVFYHEIQTRT